MTVYGIVYSKVFVPCDHLPLVVHHQLRPEVNSGTIVDGSVALALQEVIDSSSLRLHFFRVRSASRMRRILDFFLYVAKMGDDIGIKTVKV